MSFLKEAEKKQRQKLSLPRKWNLLFAPTPSGKEEPAKNEGGYKLVSKDEIAQSDLEDPSFKEALKMLPDYDIYEKD